MLTLPPPTLLDGDLSPPPRVVTSPGRSAGHTHARDLTTWFETLASATSHCTHAGATIFAAEPCQSSLTQPSSARRSSCRRSSYLRTSPCLTAAPDTRLPASQVVIGSLATLPLVSPEATSLPPLSLINRQPLLPRIKRAVSLSIYPSMLRVVLCVPECVNRYAHGLTA